MARKARKSLLPGRIAAWLSGVDIGKVSGAFTGFVGFIGLAADLGTPWANFLGILCISLIGLATVFAIISLGCRLSKSEMGVIWRVKKLVGAGFTYSLMAILILGPFYGLQRAFGGESGLIAEHVLAAEELQAFLNERFDRIESAITLLNASVEQQAEVASGIQDTMAFSVAMEVMERVRATRDGATQGQAVAMRTLLDSGFDFVGTDYSGVSFKEVVLDGAEFSEARLHFADLRGTSARGTSFRGSGLRLALANEQTVFDEADLAGVYAPLFEAPGASFRGSDLSGANFYGGDFRGADFTGANLSGAAFTFADFRGADLSDAVLDGAHLVGALMTETKIDGTRFSETNLLGAVLDPARLTAEQRAGACRHQASFHDSRVEMIERWESDRFSTGYEFDGINEYDNWVPAGPADDLSLRVCSSPAQSDTFDASYPLSLRFQLDREYLSKAGRRNAAVERFESLRARLADGRRDAVFFTDDASYREVWVEKMRAASQDVTPVGPPYVDTDFMLVFLIGRGISSPDDVDWQKAMEQRLRFERTVQQQFGGEFAKITHWGPFFPDDVRHDDMPEAALGLFRDWTLRRANTLGDEIVIRVATIVAESPDGGHVTELSFDTGFLRQTPEGRTASSSWPSHRLADEAAEAAGGADRLQFAAVDLHTHGVPRMLYAFPVPVKSYRALADTRIDGVKPAVPDVDMRLAVTQVRKLGDDRRSVMLLFVKPVSVVLHSDSPTGMRESYPLTLTPN